MRHDHLNIIDLVERGEFSSDNLVTIGLPSGDSHTFRVDDEDIKRLKVRR